MPNICFPLLGQDRKSTVPNDPFERVSTAAQAVIITSLAQFESNLGEAGNENERVALRRAFARYIIDSGIASERGWL